MYFMDTLLQRFDNLCQRSPFTNVYGLGRSILAAGTLFTLLVNNVHTLFISQNFRIRTHFILDKINLFYLFGYEHLPAAKLVAILILALVITGYLPRITGLLHWWVAYSFFNAAVIVDGGDQIAAVIALALVPLTLLDGRMNHWQKGTPAGRSRNYIAILCLFFIKIQMAVLYFNAAIAKFNVPEWLDGTVMYYWLAHNTFGLPGYMKDIVLPVVENPLGVLVLTWGTVIFEVMLFAAIFFRTGARMKMLCLGILFHLLIFLCLGLASFFFSMTGSLLLYLYPFDRHISFARHRFKLTQCAFR
ncbi:membrane protein [Chitinophaga japonensis]